MRDIDPKRLHDMEEKAREIAHLLGRAIQGSGDTERWGFALLIFSFAGPELTWIANANRDDMVKVLKELIERFEKGTADELSRPKGRG